MSFVLFVELFLAVEQKSREGADNSGEVAHRMVWFYTAPQSPMIQAGRKAVVFDG
jgi:hypothetical protein